MKEIIIDSPEEEKLKTELGKRTDADGLRMKRFLDMPDLSRTEGSPITGIVNRILKSPYFKSLDIIKTPEIVPASISFDLFDFPADHPARNPSDTYYVDSTNILRTHTTIMWYYYLLDEDIKNGLRRTSL